MQVKILGCSGGIGGGRDTTALLVDDDILIDAGTGVAALSMDELARITQVFITHTHLDHIVNLPFILDSVSEERGQALVVRALPEVIEILRRDVFNWRIWPDFSVIPDAQSPFLRFEPLAIGEAVRLGNREITAIPANHGLPAVGFLLRGARGSLLFSGDTASHDALWEIANATADLRHLIVEVSFANAKRALADLSRHYCPETLAPDLARLKPGVEVWITHLKPGREQAIMSEVMAVAPGLSVAALEEGRIFQL